MDVVAVTVAVVAAAGIVESLQWLVRMMKAVDLALLASFLYIPYIEQVFTYLIFQLETNLALAALLLLPLLPRKKAPPKSPRNAGSASPAGLKAKLRVKRIS